MMIRKRFGAATLAACFFAGAAGCEHVKATRADLTPATVTSFNAVAREKPFALQTKDGPRTRGESGLSANESTQRGWLLSVANAEPRLDFPLRDVGTIRVFEASRKSSSRGFGEGALLGLATGACLGAIVGSASHDEDDWLFDRGDVTLMGGIAGGALGGLVGGVIGVVKGSTIKNARDYSPQGF